MVSRLADPGQTSLRSRKQQRARERIYDVALELFAEQPYDEVTIERICDRAEVGRATFFRQFGSKGGLLAEFNVRLAHTIESRLREDPGAGAAARLRVVQDEIARAWESSAPSTREMGREYIRNATAADLRYGAAPGLVDLVTGIVRQGQASGEFTADYEPDLVASIILTALAGVTAGWLGASGEDPLGRGTQASITLLLDGLRAPTVDRNPRG